MKSIEIEIKEWRDKRYGNTYFSARIDVEDEEKGKTLFIPFQYGDHQHAEHLAIKKIQELLNLEKSGYSFKDTANNAGFHYYCNHTKDNKKREVQAWGEL